MALFSPFGEVLSSGARRTVASVPASLSNGARVCVKKRCGRASIRSTAAAHAGIGDRFLATAMASGGRIPVASTVAVGGVAFGLLT